MTTPSGGDRPPGRRDDLLITIVISAVLVGWLGSIIASGFVEGFEVRPELSSMMLAIVGFLFAGRNQIKKNNRGDDDQ